MICIHGAHALRGKANRVCNLSGLASRRTFRISQQTRHNVEGGKGNVPLVRQLSLQQWHSISHTAWIYFEPHRHRLPGNLRSPCAIGPVTVLKTQEYECITEAKQSEQWPCRVRNSPYKDTLNIRLHQRAELKVSATWRHKRVQDSSGFSELHIWINLSPGLLGQSNLLKRYVGVNCPFANTEYQEHAIFSLITNLAHCGTYSAK